MEEELLDTDELCTDRRERDIKKMETEKTRDKRDKKMRSVNVKNEMWK